MRAPLFWHKPRGSNAVLMLLLAPLSGLWKIAAARRLARGAREKMPVPVVCIGNINIGGTGKTPCAIALMSLLAEQGLKAHIVSRGHGGALSGPVQVDPRQHTSRQTGDEPLLMAAFGPVWVAKDRAAGARAAINAGAEIILLDDGFQNGGLFHDLSIVVVDAVVGFGNGRVLPAGPLREDLKNGLARADILISIGDQAAQSRLARNWPEITPLTRMQAQIMPLQTGMDWRGKRVIAFAGIGRPSKFFTSLKNAGADIVASHEFDDHAEYSDAVLQRLKADSIKRNAQLVTTEKDAIRLPQDFLPEVLAFPVRLEFSDRNKILKVLKALI